IVSSRSSSASARPSDFARYFAHPRSGPLRGVLDMKQRFRFVLFAAFGLAALTATGARLEAQETKVAVIDVRRLVTDSVAGKAALDELKRMQDEKVAEARTRQEEL